MTDRTKALELARAVADAVDNGEPLTFGDKEQTFAWICRALIAAEERCDRLERKLERVVGITQNLTDDVQSHSRYLSTRGKGGQQVSPVHTFASMPPSALSVVGRYARELRLATSDAEVTLATKESNDGG